MEDLWDRLNYLSQLCNTKETMARKFNDEGVSVHQKVQITRFIEIRGHELDVDRWFGNAVDLLLRLDPDFDHGNPGQPY